jgi:DNA-binding MarR family transcriptional regulator
MGDMQEHPLGVLGAHMGSEHLSTIGVLVTVLRTGRQIEAWLSATLADDGLDTSEFSMLAALVQAGPPHQRAAGELSAAVIQTTGGTTKTVRRLESRGLVRRVTDPGDGRRSLIELTSDGYDLAVATLELVRDAFDLEIGDLDEAERSELGLGLARLSVELGDRLRS